ncbi:MAG: GNAT family N-acetyltransferase [Chloroflexi bacterium]|nr:GNAT family N-acetyltransferase [Chloroflexota bacterium]
MEQLELADQLVSMRPFEPADIAPVFELAGAREIADNTFVPHPYTQEAAQEFVERVREQWSADEAYVFAILDRATDAFVGCMGIHPEATHNSATVGYWIGKPFWGRGIATAALRLLIRFGFEKLQLNRIEAGHLAHNAASGRVMQKANMQYEGRRRGSKLHRGEYKDAVWYAIIRADYCRSSKPGQSCAGEPSQELKRTPED